MMEDLADEHDTAGFRMFADDLDVAELARASTGMTGADLREVLRRAQLAKAMQEARSGRRPDPIGQQDLRHQISELAAGGAG